MQPPLGRNADSIPKEKIKEKTHRNVSFFKGKLEKGVNSPQCRNTAELFLVGDTKVMVRQSVEKLCGVS